MGALLRLFPALLLALALAAAGLGAGATAAEPGEAHCGAPASINHAHDGLAAAAVHCCAAASIPQGEARLPAPRVARLTWPTPAAHRDRGREVAPETGVPRPIS
jgi:hypothetical protein